MHSIVTTFRGAVIKVEAANLCAAMDALIDQDDNTGARTFTKSFTVEKGSKEKSEITHRLLSDIHIHTHSSL